MNDLEERMRSLSESLDGNNWNHPITAHGDCLKAAELCSLLDDPNVLLAVPQPQRMRISQLLHGAAKSGAE
jgi:hypothetical protein